VTDTLRPYLVRIEKEIQRKLLPQDGSLFAEFDVSERPERQLSRLSFYGICLASEVE
jgi:hypothetical protein